MGKKIESLSPEQEAQMKVYAAKWLAIGLDTSPADKPRAERALVECYKNGGLEPPQSFRWFGSPREMLKAASELKNSLDTNTLIQECIYGQHDAGWLSFYDFFREVVGLTEETGKLTGLIEFAKSAGWALPMEKECWVSDRPCILKQDDRQRLHSLQGPALAFRDGVEIYSVHGVLVPSDIVKSPHLITVERIEAEVNAEIRRVMLDLFGWKKYLEQSGAKEIGRDKFGILYRKDLSGDEPLVMVKVRNSTPEPDGSFKDYFLRVRPDVATAKEAVASTFQLGDSDYSPGLET